MTPSLTPVALKKPDEPAGRPIPQDPSALLHTVEAAYILGLSPRTLEALRLKGDGPPFILVTRKAVRYRRKDLDQWTLARRRYSTSDSGQVPNAPAP